VNNFLDITRLASVLGPVSAGPAGATAGATGPEAGTTGATSGTTGPETGLMKSFFPIFIELGGVSLYLLLSLIHHYAC
jgi:hypothetical protein